MSINRMRVTLSLATVLVVAGCASHPGPIIDKHGVDREKYAADLEECSEYAKEVSVVEGTARGATLGAIVGAAVGSITGNASEGAGYGAASGGVRSGVRNKDTQERVVKRCMSGRGYKVLNY